MGHSTDTSFANFIQSNLICNSPLFYLSTLKVIGDNLDLFIRSRTEISDHHADSKYFFLYAVRDRVDHSFLDDVLRPINISSVNVDDVLLKPCDIEEMKENLTIILSRKIRKHMPFLGNMLISKLFHNT